MSNWKITFLVKKPELENLGNLLLKTLTPSTYISSKTVISRLHSCNVLPKLLRNLPNCMEKIEFGFHIPKSTTLKNAHLIYVCVDFLSKYIQTCAVTIKLIGGVLFIFSDTTNA